MIYPGLFYAFFAALWFGCIFGAVILIKCRRALKDAIRDRELTDWANRMILSVTSKDGMIFSSTLGQLYRDRITDEVWTDPIAVALWHSDPAVHAAYVRQADKIHGAAHIDEKDQTT